MIESNVNNVREIAIFMDTKQFEKMDFPPGVVREMKLHLERDFPKLLVRLVQETKQRMQTLEVTVKAKEAVVAKMKEEVEVKLQEM